tara:strand:+ start:3278 stop:3718 length:441 start_codon:yes stop_codon:yes gene_type:complete
MNPIDMAWSVLKGRAITMSDWYNDELLDQHPDKLFLFGDNERRRGKGGQAAIRHHPHAHGVRTKAAPHWGNDAFWTDDNYDENVRMIDEDLDAAMATGKQIVIPEAGLGTGRARLPDLAPRTHEYLQSRLDNLMTPSKPSLFGGDE